MKVWGTSSHKPLVPFLIPNTDKMLGIKGDIFYCQTKTIQRIMNIGLFQITGNTWVSTAFINIAHCYIFWTSCLYKFNVILEEIWLLLQFLIKNVVAYLMMPHNLIIMKCFVQNVHMWYIFMIQLGEDWLWIKHLKVLLVSCNFLL